jgi:hypothetical protein
MEYSTDRSNAKAFWEEIDSLLSIDKVGEGLRLKVLRSLESGDSLFSFGHNVLSASAEQHKFALYLTDRAHECLSALRAGNWDMVVNYHGN